MKIVRMTADQERSLVKFREKWMNIGLATGKADIPAIRPVIDDFYRCIGESPPVIWGCDSPFMAQILINLWGDNLGDSLPDNLGVNLWVNLRNNLQDNLWDNLGDNLRDNLGDNLRDNLRANLGDNLLDNLRDNLRPNLGVALRNNLWDNLWDNLGVTNFGENLRANLPDNLYGTSLWGSGDSFWIAYYLFSHRFLKNMHTEKQMELLDGWATLAKNAFWWYPFSNVCFVCDRPVEIHKNEAGQLHNPGGPAVSFSDGWEVYVWNGLNLPKGKEWIVDEWNRITPDTINAESHVEIRRIMLEQFGLERYLLESDATLVDEDTDNQVQLLTLNSSWGDWQVTRSVCHTTGRVYVEGLGDNRFHTVQEAMNWQWGTEYAPDLQS